MEIMVGGSSPPARLLVLLYDGGSSIGRAWTVNPRLRVRVPPPRGWAHIV